MSVTADIPWALLAEGSVKSLGDNFIDVELAPGLRVRYAPAEGLTKSDYDFFEIEGWNEEELTPTFLPTEGLSAQVTGAGWNEEELTPTPLPLALSQKGYLSNTPWYHGKFDQPPPMFPYGPLHGTQRELAAAICPGNRVDTRRFQVKAAKGASIWVRKTHRTQYEVWFRHEGEYNKVTGKAQSAAP